MIDKLFTWDDWGQHGICLFSFYSCTLLKDVSGFKKGYVVASINVDYENGILEFCGNEGIVLKRSKIELNIID
jgi:hypothetical protein